MSDAAPLIPLALSRFLDLLPRVYEVTIPEEVFLETQHYRELPDAMEIAKAVGKWLVVRAVKDRRQVRYLVRQNLGQGEAEAIVLCKEIEADSVLTSDKYAASKAATLGVRTITISDVIKEAYSKTVMTASEAVSLLEILIGQDILNTGSIRELLREARTWP